MAYTVTVMGASTVGEHLAVAVTAGAIASKNEKVAEAIKDRYESLKRAIGRKSADIRVAPLAEDPSSSEHREALAKDLDEKGAGDEPVILGRARELLGLIKVDEAAQDALEAMKDDVEASLVALSEIEFEEEPEGGDVPAPLETSRRELPPYEPSTTELERMAQPIWKRTDRFFLKAGLLVGSYVALFAVYWFFVRTPPNDAMEKCRQGDGPRCWEVVAAQDTIEQGVRVESEPLEVLCKGYKDACACAGLAYLNAANVEHSAQCSDLSPATSLNPQWPCTCTHYAFWRRGQQRLSSCGIARCE